AEGQDVEPAAVREVEYRPAVPAAQLNAVQHGHGRRAEREPRLPAVERELDGTDAARRASGNGRAPQCKRPSEESAEGTDHYGPSDSPRPTHGYLLVRPPRYSGRESVPSLGHRLSQVNLFRITRVRIEPMHIPATWRVWRIGIQGKRTPPGQVGRNGKRRRWSRPREGFSSGPICVL